MASKEGVDLGGDGVAPAQEGREGAATATASERIREAREAGHRNGYAGIRVYAAESKKWEAGDKTEDELLQRIWNLAWDVTLLCDELDRR